MRLLTLALLTLPITANTVTGTLQIDGKTYPLTHAIAVRVPGPFNPATLVTRAAFTDAPITPEELRSNTALLAREKASPIHGVTIECSDDRSSFSLALINSENSASASISGTMHQFNFVTHSPQRIKGTYKLPERSFGPLRLAIDVDFDLPVTPPAPKGDVKKGAEAQTLESVKAYLALRKAVQALDLPTIQKLARFPQDFQGPDGLKFVKLMKEEEPTGIVVVEASETADTATLTITATKDGKPIKKTFDMQRKDGRWTTNNDNWEAN